MNTFKKLRKIAGLTQEEAGAKIGVSGGAVQKWEYGTAKPKSSLWKRITEVYGTTEETLLMLCHDDDDISVPSNHSHNPAPDHSNPPTNIRGQMNSTERFFWKMYKRHGSEDFLEDCIKVLIERKEEAEFLKKSEGKNISNG